MATQYPWRHRPQRPTAGSDAVQACVDWLICGVTMAVGRMLLGPAAAVTIHALIAPATASLISLRHFCGRRTSDLLGAAALLATMFLVLDAHVVAPLCDRGHAMLPRPLLAWIPFSLLFAGTYAAALWAARVPIS